MFFTYSIFAFLLGRINIILPVAGLNLSLIIFGIAICNTVIALLYGTNRKKVNKQKA
jgi:hypothetical protein